MKIVISGGSGQIGTFLARALVNLGHEVVVLSRVAKTSAVAATERGSAKTSDSWRTDLPRS